MRVSQEIQWLLEEKYHMPFVPLRGISRRGTKEDITRVQKGEHIDYVIGFVNFLGCKIDLSCKPFIPRPETEYWVRKALQDIRTASFLCALPHISPAGSTWAPTRLQKSRSTHIRCLDLFAGSGCIGVAVLKHVPRAHVDFGEKNKRLLSQIRLNVKKNGIAKTRYRIIQTNIFSGIKGRYDYIFANPPYIAESRKDKVQSSVLKHEPREALFAGKYGLDIIQPFLRQAKDFLVEGGVVYLEFDSFQKQPVEQHLKKIGYYSWQFLKDQYGKWRSVVIHT